jgi:leucyl/phenylalanyl-tRNA--protein transferase
MSDLNDIVAVGLDLKPRTLLHAYQNGIFPWPTEGLPLLWYCPLKRGVIQFKNLHIGRRLKQTLKTKTWTYTVDQAFERVIDLCAETRFKDGVPEGTWITHEMRNAYLKLHELGHAHSVEVWDGKNLIAGLYGVDTGGYFAGESMFHRESNASKGAILYTISLLLKSGRQWMDTQVITPHVEALGGKEVTRTQFLKMVETGKKSEKLGTGIKPFAVDGPASFSEIEKIWTEYFA